MKSKILTPEKLEKLRELQKQLTELQQRSDERIVLFESVLKNKELYRDQSAIINIKPHLVVLGGVII